MEQTVKGTYQRLSEPELIEPSAYVRFSNDQAKEQEILVELMNLQTADIHAWMKINLEPVYIAEETNELVYHSRMMEKGKKYYVKWDGERFMLIKDDENVTIYKLEDDEEWVGKLKGM